MSGKSAILNPLVLLFVLGAVLSWGIYVPTVHTAASQLHSNLRAFLFVGVAYFLVAVLVPAFMIFVLKWDPTAKASPNFNAGPIMWGIGAGTAGAVGALCVIFAATAAGSPLVVAPLVFAGAPIINTIATITYFHPVKQMPNWKFFLGLLLAVAGAACVMIFKGGPVNASVWDSINATALMFVAGAALSWGNYVPLVHEAAMKLHSNLRAFLFVGVAYFLVAVLVPSVMIFGMNFDPTAKGVPNFDTVPVSWGILAGVAGAAGALFVIFAVTKAGRGGALYVAPLVFAGAPIVNTIATMTIFHPPKNPPAMPFYLGLALAAVGAAMVMLFKPTAPPPAPAAATPEATANGIVRK
jgi:drug/metabolite transporter (DMT)-like permease